MVLADYAFGSGSGFERRLVDEGLRTWMSRFLHFNLESCLWGDFAQPLITKYIAEIALWRVALRLKENTVRATIRPKKDCHRNVEYSAKRKGRRER